MLEFHSVTLYLFISTSFIFLDPVILRNSRCTKNPKNPLCPPGLKNFPESGMCLFVESSQNRDWYRAVQYCISKFTIQASLVVIGSEMDEKFVEEMVPLLPRKHWMWMSATRSPHFEWHHFRLSGKLLYTNWADAANSVPSVNKRCVYRDAINGKWYKDSCRSTLPFICSIRYAKNINITLGVHKISPPGIAYIEEPIHFKCTAWIYQRGQVKFLWQPVNSNERIMTTQEINTLNGTSAEVSSDQNDCMRKVEVKLSIYPSTLGPLPPLRCCLVISGAKAECSQTISLQIKERVFIRPKLDVSYHNPPPSIYFDKKVQATCFTNNGKHAWALSSPLGVVIWRKDRAGILQPNNPGNVLAKYVEVKILKDTHDFTLGYVTNSSFTFVAKPEYNQAILYCYGRDVASPSDIIRAKDFFRSESLEFEAKMYYAPQKLHMDLRYHQAKGVVYEGKNFTVNCSAAVGTNGFMILSMQRRKELSQWYIFDNGTVTTLHDEIHYTYKKNIVYFKDKRGPHILATVEILVTKSVNNTVVSCATSGIEDPNSPDKCGSFWKQVLKTHHLIVYEQPCEDVEVRRRRQYIQRRVAYGNYSLVYFICRRRGFKTNDEWPLLCYRDPGNGFLIWNGTFPVCIPKPFLIHWLFFWYKELFFLFFAIVVILLLIAPRESSHGDIGGAEIIVKQIMNEQKSDSVLDEEDNKLGTAW